MHVTLNYTQLNFLELLTSRLSNHKHGCSYLHPSELDVYIFVYLMYIYATFYTYNCSGVAGSIYGYIIVPKYTAVLVQMTGTPLKHVSKGYIVGSIADQSSDIIIVVMVTHTSV